MDTDAAGVVTAGVGVIDAEVTVTEIDEVGFEEFDVGDNVDVKVRVVDTLEAAAAVEAVDVTVAPGVVTVLDDPDCALDATVPDDVVPFNVAVKLFELAVT